MFVCLVLCSAGGPYPWRRQSVTAGADRKSLEPGALALQTHTFVTYTVQTQVLLISVHSFCRKWFAFAYDVLAEAKSSEERPDSRSLLFTLHIVDTRSLQLHHVISNVMIYVTIARCTSAMRRISRTWSRRLGFLRDCQKNPASGHWWFVVQF